MVTRNVVRKRITKSPSRSEGPRGRRSATGRAREGEGGQKVGPKRGGGKMFFGQVLGGGGGKLRASIEITEIRPRGCHGIWSSGKKGGRGAK